MKIRFVESQLVDGVTYERGTEHDLDVQRANHLVQAGIATKADETQFARPSTLRREPDPASTAAIAAFNPALVDPTVPKSSGNPPARVTSAPPLVEPEAPAPGPPARAARAR